MMMTTTVMMMMMMIPPFHDVSPQTVNYSSALLFLLLANISGFVFIFMFGLYGFKKKRLLSPFFFSPIDSTEH